jgi:predicted DNA-binding transcriptional regulator AlpA
MRGAKMIDNPDLISTEEVAELTDSSTRHVKHLMKTEGFPAPYVISPRKIRHSRQAILEWLESTRQAAGLNREG